MRARAGQSVAPLAAHVYGSGALRSVLRLRQAPGVLLPQAVRQGAATGVLTAPAAGIAGSVGRHSRRRG